MTYDNELIRFEPPLFEHSQPGALPNQPALLRIRPESIPSFTAARADIRGLALAAADGESSMLSPST